MKRSLIDRLTTADISYLSKEILTRVNNLDSYISWYHPEDERGRNKINIIKSKMSFLSMVIDYQKEENQGGNDSTDADN